uniref:Reverse transcriptase/retrotransposon-derived protein RNase H-like domain-containing protein n=1 Tax=Anabas testudineus TaxID=64144 RepID=A0AAQ6IRH6_ANATE
HGEKQMAMKANLTWTKDTETTFNDLKQALASTPDFQTTPNHLIFLCLNVMTSCRCSYTKSQDNKQRPVGYHSKYLSTTERVVVACLRACHTKIMCKSIAYQVLILNLLIAFLLPTSVAV